MSQSDSVVFIFIFRCGMVLNNALVETMGFAMYRENLFGLNDSFLMVAWIKIRQRTDLLLNWSRLQSRGCVLLAHISYKRMRFCKIIRWVPASTAYGSVNLQSSCWWTFTSQSKTSQKCNKKSNFSKTNKSITAANNLYQTIKKNGHT